MKWIAAVEAIGLNAKVHDDAITIDFRIRTNPDGLTDADLPIAPGDEAPPIVDRDGEIGIGFRGLDQTVSFVETVAQAVAPSDYGDYAAAKTQLERKLGVDVEKDIFGQLSGDISASISLDGKFGIRVEPKDPEAFDEDALQRSRARCRCSPGPPRPRRRQRSCGPRAERTSTRSPRRAATASSSA